MRARQPNAQYNLAAPGSMPVRIAGHMRRRMYEHFLRSSGVASGDTLLDVGVTSDRTYRSSNYLEAWYPEKEHIVAVGLDDAAFLERLHPGLRFVRADGLALPFADRSFDHVHASAVLEHVGDRQRQRRLIEECHRVARRTVFLTTPNRWFPVEFHTVLPLVHWLPSPVFRAILRHSGRAFLAEESNLNLLTPSEVKGLCRDLGLGGARVSCVALGGWPSNIILSLERA